MLLSSIHRDGLCRSIYTSNLLSVCVVIFFFVYFRPNTSVPSPPSTEMNESLPTTKTGVPLNRQSSDEANGQQGKRKFSLSQYKEHKRLKSNEIQLGDTDMRINNLGNSKVRFAFLKI